MPLSRTLDHVGIMARELGLIKKIFNLLASEEPASNNSRRRRQTVHHRIGIWDVENWVEPEVWQRLLTVADKFRSAGYGIDKVSFKIEPSDLYSKIVLPEAAALRKIALSEPNPKFGEMTLKLLQLGQTITNEEHIQALSTRLAKQTEISEIFQRYDYLLAPTVPCVAPKIETQSLALPEGDTPLRQALLRLTSPWSLIGVPTLNVPIPLQGLFVGAQIIAPFGADEELLDFAEAQGWEPVHSDVLG